MKNNQSGFSAVEAVVIIVVVGLLSFGGWYVWQNQRDDKSQKSTETTSDSKTHDVAKVDTSITDVEISLKTEDDISKLPAKTPASFKSYLLEKLKNNTPDSSGCIEQYSISKISSVNIKGGGASVSAGANDNGSCIGGAPRVWVLTPNNTWDDVSLNGPVCTSENGGLVYDEFAQECYTDPNADTLVKNPNGSITLLAGH